jgi:ribonuclease R
MSRAEAVVKLMLERDYVPLPLPRVAEKLGVAPEEAAAFRAEVDSLRMAGLVVVMKKERLALAKGTGELAFGKMHFHTGRAPAFFFPDAADGKAEPLKVEETDTGIALHGDRVIARILPRRGLRGRTRGEVPPRYAYVLFVLERARTRFVGTLSGRAGRWYVVADDPRVRAAFSVDDPAQSEIEPKPASGDCVMVELTRWDSPHMEPEGCLVSSFGRARTPDAEYLSILAQYDLSPEFPKAVEAAAAAWGNRVPERDCEGRLDLRKSRVFTVDPDTARDFDDALSIEPREGGGWRVGIHIADVSHYVKAGGSLDEEAERRGNSTYLVGTVIPMLPHALSSGLCSLMEGRARLTKSVFAEFDEKGEFLPKKTTFANSVIESVKRLNYHQALAFLRGASAAEIRALPEAAAHETGHAGRPLALLTDAEIAGLSGDLRALWKIGQKLRRERMFSGALDLDMPDVAIHVDKEGYACRLEKLDYDESHQLVEEFMLLANEAVDRALSGAGLPLIHRVHDKPDEPRLQELAEHLRSMGMDVHDLSGRKELSRALDLIRAHPQSQILRTEFLKSLKQACYRASPDGHFGLNKTYYTHFTSPIRRYADLVVHRVFDAFLDGTRGVGAHQSARRYSTAELAAICAHISITEQNSTQAERDSVRVKMLEYFERECEGRPEVTFEAVVMDIRRRGIFVELTQNLAYGLVPTSSLRDDIYSFDEREKRLRGRRSGREFRVGDALIVSVAKVDRARRLIDFAPAEKFAKAGKTGGVKKPVKPARPEQPRRSAKPATPEKKGKARQEKPKEKRRRS